MTEYIGSDYVVINSWLRVSSSLNNINCLIFSICVRFLRNLRNSWCSSVRNFSPNPSEQRGSLFVKFFWFTLFFFLVCSEIDFFRQNTSRQLKFRACH